MAFIIVHMVLVAIGAVILPKGSRLQRYCFNTLIAYDQLGNVMVGGDPDETLSSRAAKNQHVWVWRQLGYVLEWIDPGHLKNALEPDEGKDAAWRKDNGTT